MLKFFVHMFFLHELIGASVLCFVKIFLVDLRCYCFKSFKRRHIIFYNFPSLYGIASLPRKGIRLLRENLVYIKSLVQAAKIYTELSGVMPSTSISSIESVLAYLSKHQYIPSSNKWATKTRIGSSLFPSKKHPGNMAYGVCVLLHKLGFLQRKTPSEYRLNREGKQITTKYFDRQTNTWDAQYRIFLLERLLGLEAMKVLLSFLYDNPKITAKAVVKQLGGEMKHHSRVLVPLDVVSRGRYPLVAKPFNNAIVPMLLNLLESLGVIEEKTKGYALTPLAATWMRRTYQQYERTTDKFVWTAPKEPLLLVAIAEIIRKSEKTVHIVSPYLNTQAIELFDDTDLLQDVHVKLISRNPTKRTKKVISKLHSYTNVTTRFLPKKKYWPKKTEATPLHAKMVLADTHRAGLITSANLLHTSLVRNYETGILTYDISKNYQLDNLFQTMWERGVKK